MKIVQHSDRITALQFKNTHASVTPIMHYEMPGDLYYSQVTDGFNMTGLTEAAPGTTVDNEYPLLADIDSYALYRYVEPAAKNNDVTTIDFKVHLLPQYTLKKRPIVTNGKLTEITYFISYDSVAKIFSNPVVRISFTYTFDVDNLLTEKTKTIEWYLEDGTIGPASKNVGQVYHPQYDYYVIVKEIHGIRGRFMNELLMSISDMARTYGGFATDADAYAAEDTLTSGGSVETDIFIKYGNKTPFETYIQNDSATWLDNMNTVSGQTIRNTILSDIGAFDITV